ncbi:hypothetical protein PNOK_0024700 [Pyrrhoderma noxium]|uniref:Cx9C motif-containing protein 4, mitochondrial n=1 Tax=Pyrrhoderma noxium TaxID=2282107 RepID=A0A286UUB7_9AGAM|nr:hypothetical protein PNOK_0024700 [Pyrrhoderma noxium]
MSRRPSRDDPLCQDEACSLQSCLGRNTYSPEKCNAQLRRLYECCREMYVDTSGKGQSTACPKEQVVRRWLETQGSQTG